MKKRERICVTVSTLFCPNEVQWRTRIQVEHSNMNHLSNVATRGKLLCIPAAQDECAHVSDKQLLGFSLGAEVNLE